MRRGFLGVAAWLAALFGPLLRKPEPDSWEIQVSYRTPGGADKPVGTVVPAAAHCVNCGHAGTVWVPHGDPVPLENEIVDMLQCPVCHLYCMCSD